MRGAQESQWSTARRFLGVLALAVTVTSVSSVTTAGASPTQDTLVAERPARTTPHAVDDSIVANAAVQTFSQAGETMYAGGRFHSVQDPAQTTTYTRTNLFSFDVTTGQPTEWSPRVNGEVLATLAGTKYLYVAGSFSRASRLRNHLVRYELSTGKIDRSWNPGITADYTVSDLAFSHGALVVAGAFPQRLVTISMATGRKTPYLKPTITGTVAPNAGRVAVYRFAINPAGTRLLAIGNFTQVNGKPRARAFMLNLGTDRASLNSWYYQPLTKMCEAFDTPDYLRDVDFSPDGSYFVLVASGFVPRSGDRFSTICDAAARFETDIPSPSAPTWINYTGGDSLYSVAAVGSTVYVGGHQRWLDNPYGRNEADVGAVSRPGVGAIDPDTGLAADWNPTKTRGIGLKFIYPTVDGVWFGSDGRHFNYEVHDAIAFSPLN